MVQSCWSPSFSSSAGKPSSPTAFAFATCENSIINQTYIGDHSAHQFRHVVHSSHSADNDYSREGEAVSG